MIDEEICASVLRFGAQRVLKHLEFSQAWQQMVLAEGQFHTGDDPIVADQDAHDEFERSIRSHPAWSELRIWGVVGEENMVPKPRQFQPGTRVIVLDPLDGSTMWAMMRQGYCVAAMSLLAREGGQLTLECAVIATPVHTFTLIGDELRFGPTFEGPEQDILLLSVLPETEVRQPSLAINGFKARDRALFQEVLGRLPNWDVVTLGGNPTNPYVIMGNLTGTVNTRHQCTWDALGILMCTTTDAVVGDLTGTVVAGRAFRDIFNRLLLGGNVKCVPPMAVAKNNERYQEIVKAVGGALEAVPPPSHDAP